MSDVSSARVGRLGSSVRSREADADPHSRFRARVDRLTLAVVGVMGVSLVLGLIRLGAPSFWLDEASTARAVRELRLNPLEQYHWLYYSLETSWALVFGTSELALRAPSVLGAMAACGLLVLLAARLFGTGVAVASGLLLATNPLLVQWSQQARGYSLMVALAVLATLLLFRALDRGSRAAWLVYGASFAAVVLWHPVAGVVLAPAHLVVLAQNRRRALPHALLAAAVVLAVGAPWAAITVIISTGEGVAMDWLEAPTFGETVRTLASVSGITGLGLVLATLGLWVLRRSRREGQTAWLAAWAFAPFVVALLVSVERPIFLDRYLMVASPAFALLAGVAIMGVGRRLRAVLVAVTVAATAVGLTQWYVSGVDGNWRGEDWRAATRYVLSERTDADAVVVAEWAAHPAAEYYGADVVDVSTAHSIWLIRWSEDGDDLTLRERAALGFGGHRIAEVVDFGGRLRVQRWLRER